MWQCKIMDITSQYDDSPNANLKPQIENHKSNHTCLRYPIVSQAFALLCLQK